MTTTPEEAAKQVTTISSARRRLMRDFKRIQTDAPPGISAAPKDNDIMNWNAIIFGPTDTPFEDGTFNLSMSFTEQYPNKPPVVKFRTRMFHPNVYNDGSICLDILQNRWSPTYDVSAILTSIQSLLDEPNPNSPANALAAQLYTENRNEYVKRVAAVVEQSWKDISDRDAPKGAANATTDTTTATASSASSATNSASASGSSSGNNNSSSTA